MREKKEKVIKGERERGRDRGGGWAGNEAMPETNNLAFRFNFFYN